MTGAVHAFEPFRADHRRVLSRLEELERAIGRSGRGRRLGRGAEAELKDLVSLLFQQFASHMAAEEHVLYPALAESFPEAGPSLEPLKSEHAEMRNMLLRLDELLGRPGGPDRDEQLVVQAQDLVDLLRIHIRKEERAVFTVASRVLTRRELSRVADRIAAHRDPAQRGRRPSRKGMRS